MDSQATNPDPKLTALFSAVEDQFQKTQLGPERWYILTIACLAASPDPDAAAHLYLHLVEQPNYLTSSARQALVRRLREALVKSISIVGVCKPLEAILAISKVERDEDKDYSGTREGWQCDAANHERGQEWFRKIYTRNSADLMALFDSHKDFAWISAEITYGFYLGDRQVLDDLDTEMVVFPAIMMQNLRLETHWHIRGTRRIGVSKEDTKVLWDTIQMVAKHFDVKLNKVPTVEEVEPDV